MKTNTKKTVVVGMSGGVDSSVAAKLLLDDGFNVVGLFMHNWEEDDGGVCTSADDYRDAATVCGKLGIPIYSVNFSKDYMERVFAYFLSEYKKGRTPNPDVLCNREIKFGPFRRYAKELGADYIATGHYCDIGEYLGKPALLKAADENKDQTYFLNNVRTEQLENVLFPLGRLKKPEVREIAEREQLVTARKKDSTGICFIGERNFKKFLSEYLPAQKGKIVDIHGKEIGVHDGLMYYTIGQRRGLGIGGIGGEENNRWYVVEKRLDKNELVVSNGEGEELFYSALVSDKINFIGDVHFLGNEFDCTAKCRYRQSEQKAHVILNADGSARVEFSEPQRAVTEGQYVVLYHENRCLGGGTIDKAERSA